MSDSATLPFVFVSYAHRDSARIQDSLEITHKVAGTVWLDEHIGAGTSWREEIAQAIERCDVFLLFVSPVSIASEHCLRELNFALENGCRIVAVHLEPTELSAGLKMSLMERQAILKYKLNAADYAERLKAGISHSPPLSTSIVTPRGKGRMLSAMAVALFVVLVGIGAYWWSGSTSRPNKDTQATDVQATKDSRAQPSIALMPFQAITGDPAVAKGFHADVLAKLTRLPGVLLISIDSLNEMQRRQASIQEIATSLKVTHVVQGDVQQRAEQLRINIKMLEARTGRVVWSEQYDRGMLDVFSVQTEIANLVARSLNVELNVNQQVLLADVPTTNAQAWGLYKRAQAEPENKDQLLQQAIALDPDFADAISSLARHRALLNDFSDDNIALARQAVALKPQRADFLVTLASALSLRFPAESREYFEQALELDPLASSMRYARAMFWVNGDLDLALENISRQRRIDPLNPSPTFVTALIAGRRFDEAAEVVTVLEAIRDNGQRGLLSAELHVAQNQITDALKLLHESSSEHLGIRLLKARLLNDIGLKQQALDLVADLPSTLTLIKTKAEILRDLGRLQELDIDSLEAIPRMHQNSIKLVERYRAGEREPVLADMRIVLNQFVGLLDEVEARFGNDHVPGHLFRVDAPLSLPLMAQLTGNPALMERIMRKVRYTLAHGGTLEEPKREHLLLLMGAALEHNHEEAIRQLDLARQRGVRNMAMLDFFGLVDDRHKLYGGLTDNPRYGAILNAIELSNQATIAALRGQGPHEPKSLSPT